VIFFRRDWYIIIGLFTSIRDLGRGLFQEDARFAFLLSGRWWRRT
jgi:hypothetical protein